MKAMQRCRWLVPVVLLAMAASAAVASGYHIYEQGGKASGQAVAFVARADDASAAYYNPAAITKLEGTQLQFGVSAVFLGDTDFATNTQSAYIIGTSAASTNMDDNTGLPVHAHLVHRFAGTRFALAASVTVPFGLVTEWTDPTFAGRFAAWKTDLRTLNFNVSGAVDFGNNFSGAIGVNWIYADLKDFSRRLANVTLGENPATAAEFLSNLEGDGDEFGWNAALHWKNDDWALGATYRSELDVDVEGDLQFIDVPAGAPEGGPLAGIPYSALFPATNAARGTLKLPSTWAAGIAYTGLERWEFEFNVHAIDWSHFDEVVIDVVNPAGAVDDTTVEENWEDTTSYRLGAAFDLAPAHQLRFGAYTEDTAIPLRYLRPSIPDGDRIGYTLGYGFTGKNFTLDAYVLHIEVDDVAVGPADLDPAATPADPVFQLEEQSRLGAYDSTTDLIGVSASFRF